MTEKYLVGDLTSTEKKDIVIEGWSNAVDWVEEYVGQFDEQIFLGIWLEETQDLFAIFDGNDWYTK